VELAENQSNFDQKPTGKSDSILTGSGISYAQIPRNLFRLTEVDHITPSDVLLALRMFDWCHQKRKFPKFEVSISDLVKATKLSRRQVLYGIDRLSALGLFIARITPGSMTEYQWNEYFLLTGNLDEKRASANFAPAQVQILHQPCANVAPVLVQNLHAIYIEFLLDYLFKLYLEYFSANISLVKRVPPKRGQKGVPKDFGTHYYVTRAQAWTEAIEASIKVGGYVRTYLACAGGFNIDSVSFPKAYLKKLIWDEVHQYESKKKSHLYKNGTLDSDEIFLTWLYERNKRGEIKESEKELDDLSVELIHMTGTEESGEERQ
jgi:hypothetical protein